MNKKKGEIVIVRKMLDSIRKESKDYKNKKRSKGRGKVKS